MSYCLVSSTNFHQHYSLPFTRATSFPLTSWSSSQVLLLTSHLLSHVITSAWPIAPSQKGHQDSEWQTHLQWQCLSVSPFSSLRVSAESWQPPRWAFAEGRWVLEGAEFGIEVAIFVIWEKGGWGREVARWLRGAIGGYLFDVVLIRFIIAVSAI